MRLTIVISSFRTRGAERVVCNMANYWVRVGNEVSVFTLTDASIDHYKLDERVERSVVDHFGTETGLLSRAIAVIKRVRRLRIGIIATDRMWLSALSRRPASEC